MIIRKNTVASNFGLYGEDVDSGISHSNEEYMNTLIHTVQTELESIGMEDVVIHDGKTFLKITLRTNLELREYQVPHSDLSYNVDYAEADGRAIVDEVFLDG